MRVVILGNGKWEQPNDFLARLRKKDLIIACNGAFHKAKKFGIPAHVLIGDLDSLPKSLRAPEIRVMAYPKEKNETDSELALHYALKKKPAQIIWYSPFGNRWDHSFANFFLLLQAVEKKVPVLLVQGRWSLQFNLKKTVLSGKKGDRVSLLPLTEKVFGITTSGLKYALQREDLDQYHTRGISNFMISKRAEVRWTEGVLLVFHESSRKNSSLKKNTN